MNHTHHFRQEQAPSNLADGWKLYQQALERMDDINWGQALRLMIEAEARFQHDQDLHGLWRALISQSILHWRQRAKQVAVMRAQRALNVATSAGDHTAAGYVAWQIAMLGIRQSNYPKAAEYLSRALTEFASSNGGPPDDLLGAALHYCLEITYWQRSTLSHNGEQAMRAEEFAAIQQELTIRLDRASTWMKGAYLRQDKQLPQRVPEPLAPMPDPFMDTPSLQPSAFPHNGQKSHTAPLPAVERRAFERRAADTPAAVPAQRPSLPAPHSQALAPAAGSAPALQALRSTQPDLSVYCFGGLRVYIGHTLVEHWESTRSRTIFKYLIMQRPHPISKEVLMTMFWPDTEPELARRSLHQAIYCLRQTLKQIAPELQIVQFIDDHYLIDPQLTIQTDFDQFTAAIEQARLLKTQGRVDDATHLYALAVCLYDGEFHEDRYEEWSERSQRFYQTAFLEALYALALRACGQGNHAETTKLCHAILDKEPCDEDAHRLLMACYLEQGLRHLAVRQYHLCVSTLRAEFNLLPSDDLVRFYQSIVDETPDEQVRQVGG